jgi:Rrf2 family protein
MRLTKLTGHAMRVLVHCARVGDELVKTATVSAELGLTAPNMFKIVYILSHAGFLKAVRGPRGGIMLARPADEIRVGDIVRATEVTSVEIEGLIESPAGPRRKRSGETPKIALALDEALHAFTSVLDQHTLADLAGTRPSPSKARKVSAKGTGTARGAGKAATKPSASRPSAARSAQPSAGARR